MPVNVNLSRNEQHRFDGPIRSFEVQQGSAELKLPNGRTTHAATAGQTIPGGDIGSTILTALEPSIVRVISTSEAEAAEKRGQRTAERQAQKASQGEDARPETRPPMQPPIH